MLKYKYTQSWFLDSEIYRDLLKICNGNLKYKYSNYTKMNDVTLFITSCYLLNQNIYN